MMENTKKEYIHYPPFRPSLGGCVGRDARLASAVYTCSMEAFVSISDNVYRSLICRDCDTELSDLFEELAQADLELFRTLGELFLALGGGGGQKRLCHTSCKRSCVSAHRQDSLVQSALWERRRNIDCFETLMGRTEDRVVRSVFSKLLSSEQLLCRRLEVFCKE